MEAGLENMDAESIVMASAAAIETVSTGFFFAVSCGVAFWMRQRGRRNLSARAAASKTSEIFNESTESCVAGSNDSESEETKTQQELWSECDAIAAAVSAGRAKELPHLLSRARTKAAERCADAKLAIRHFLAALRACAVDGYFHEALTAYDHEASVIGAGCSTLWSLLLYTAVEAREFERCDFFLGELCKSGAPSGHDFVNVVRYHLYIQDLSALRTRLQMFRAKEFRLDVTSRNRALSVCTSMRAFAFAELIADEKETGVVMDVVAFNMLIKGYAQEKNITQCAKLWADMQQLGLKPSEVTFGIMLDTLIASGEWDLAKSVFSDLRNYGVEMNEVHFPVFIKGLCTAGYLDDAIDVLDEMIQSCNSKPDLVTYSTLVKAQADHGNVKGAIRVLERMTGTGVRPDAMILNMVLGGCTVMAMEASTVFETLNWLIEQGLKPSTSTLSVLIKALSKSNSWDAAFDLLDTASEKLSVFPENRLYVQLAQACATANNAPRVLQAYEALLRSAAVRGAPIDHHTNARLVRLATSFGFGAVASQLSDTIGQADGMVNLPALQEVVVRVEQQ
eukprot:TRINITY_DN1361_c0_g2_i1.p1 TRINITY_DN1361_c0_g2~~TRINITY_DN1361_c0_g2_i1.p1  ORF type:complete len:650 (-),score=112.82 TRINITY_DN1361_c0_g2_i1:334-2031(-)